VLDEVDPSSIGQCTGLRDKNGTLIFEGDIVRGTGCAGETLAKGLYPVAFDGARMLYVRLGALRFLGDAEGRVRPG